MKKTLKELSYFIVPATWGLSFVLMKDISESISPQAFVALRFLLASVIMFFIFPKSFFRINKNLIKYSIILGFLIFASIFLQILGLRYTSASNSAFITAISVLMVPVLSALILKKAPTKSNVLGVILAIIGLFLVTGGLNFNFNIGDLLSLIAALIITFQIIVVDKFTQTENALDLGIWQLVFCGLLGALAWFFTDFAKNITNPALMATDFIAVIKTPNIASAVVLTAFFCTAIAYTGQVVVQKQTSPTRASLIFSLEPVFAMVYALLIPINGSTETITYIKFTGCFLVLLGTITSETSFFNRRKYKKTKIY